MPKFCMKCNATISPDDFRAKKCLKVIEMEKFPFFVPIPIAEDVHPSSYLCGQCAQGIDKCPYCGGKLLPSEVMAGLEALCSFAEKEFKRRKLPGEFYAVARTKKGSINICYTDNDGLKDIELN